ncbi:MAG TPA: hypothetical protein VEM93_08980 [Actinomycetota bacterium]|nr:hypothetical protein [Actinomycetota bacterium]
MQWVRITAVSVETTEVRVEPVLHRRRQSRGQRTVGTVGRGIAAEAARSFARVVPWVAPSLIDR